MVISSGLSLPPQFFSGNLNKGDVVVEPLEGHNVPLVEGLSVIAGGSEDDPEVLCVKSRTDFLWYKLSLRSRASCCGPPMVALS